MAACPNLPGRDRLAPLALAPVFTKGTCLMSTKRKMPAPLVSVTRAWPCRSYFPNDRHSTCQDPGGGEEWRTKKEDEEVTD